MYTGSFTLYRNHVNQFCYWVPIITKLSKVALKLALKLLQTVEIKYKLVRNKIAVMYSPPLKNSGTTFFKKQVERFTKGNARGFYKRVYWFYFKPFYRFKVYL